MLSSLTRHTAIMALAATVLVSPPLVERGHAESGINVGVLTCDQVSGTRVNLIIHSSAQVTCVFDTPWGREHYKGTTGIGLGADLTFGKTSRMTFAVLMATSDVSIGSHSLAGSYVGGKASAAAGVGVGVAALIGGGAKNVSLQPVAVEMGTGLGASVGLTYLTLEPDPGA